MTVVQGTALDIVEVMSEPALYGPQIEHVELAETHISWVFLVGERAYKVKKPVVMPFLDYGTLERRRHFCVEEVRLNRRLAPRTYLGVRALVHSRAGNFELASADAPDALEYVVEMRRVPAQRTLAALLARGAADEEIIDAVGRRIAAFHAEAPVMRRAATAELASQLADSFATLRELAAASDQRALELLEQALDARMTALHPELGERERAGLVRDCHGDLRAEHVVVGRPLEIFDCIEFNPALREIDVGADAGFLLMDVERLGGRRPAQMVLDAYRRGGGDPGSPALIALFCAYRSLVRAKVALLRAAELDGDADRAEAQRMLALTWRFVWRGQEPLVVVVCGPAATGKTTLARELAEVTGLPHLSSDRTRKRLAGLEPQERGTPELYTDAMNARVYAELGSLARGALADGGAIVDATFRRSRDRAAFAAALGDVAPVFVECSAPEAVVAERATRRLEDARDASDADARVALDQIAAFEPLSEIPRERRIEIRTDRSPEALATEVGLAVARLGP